MSRLTHYEITRGEIHAIVGINQRVEMLEVGQSPAQVRNLHEAEPHRGVPDPVGYVLRVTTLVCTDSRYFFKLDRQHPPPFVERAHVLDVVNHQRRYLLRGGFRQKNGRSGYARYLACSQVAQDL